MASHPAETVVVLKKGEGGGVLLLLRHFSRCLSWSCRFLECSTLEDGKEFSARQRFVLWLTDETVMSAEA